MSVPPRQILNKCQNVFLINLGIKINIKLTDILKSVYMFLSILPGNNHNPKIGVDLYHLDFYTFAAYLCIHKHIERIFIFLTFACFHFLKKVFSNILSFIK